MHFPIHEVAMQHSIAASDSDDDQPGHGADSTWWSEVEAFIEDDLRADREWWGEVEDAIRPDEVIESQSSRVEVSCAGAKRERSQFCIASNAKRVKKPDLVLAFIA